MKNSYLKNLFYCFFKKITINKSKEIQIREADFIVFEVWDRFY